MPPKTDETWTAKTEEEIQKDLDRFDETAEDLRLLAEAVIADGDSDKAVNISGSVAILSGMRTLVEVSNQQRIATKSLSESSGRLELLTKVLLFLTVAIAVLTTVMSVVAFTK